MTPPTAVVPAKKSKTTSAPVGAPCYAGRLLRVDMTTGKCWAEPWGEAQQREQLGGVGLGAMILYKETGKGKKNVHCVMPKSLWRR